MFSSIRIQGLGPHVNHTFHFDAAGVTEIWGRSEQGKSTLLDAIAFVLWGQGRDGTPLDEACVHDGADQVHVDLTLRSGVTFSRSRSRKRSGKRRIRRRMFDKSGAVEEYGSEAAWRGALRHFGLQVDALRCVITPFAWRRLALGTGDGRPFRDLLDTVLPTAGTRREVVEQLLAARGRQLRSDDPITMSGAQDARRYAREGHDRATAAISTLQRSIDKLANTEIPDRPSKHDVEQAEHVLYRAEVWKAGDPARTEYDERLFEVARLRGDLADWQAQIAALGPCPESSGDLEAARLALNELRGKRVPIQHHLQDLRRQLPVVPDDLAPAQHYDDAIMRAKKAVQEAHDAVLLASDICPTCNRSGWQGAAVAAADRLANARVDLQVAESTQAAEQERIERLLEQLRAKRLDVETRIESTEGQLTELEADIETAVGALAALQAGNRPARTWQHKRELIGDAPVVPDLLPEVPCPDFERPSDDAIADATAVRQAEHEATTAAAQQQRDLDQLRMQLAASEKDARVYKARLEHCEALVAAVRAEPSESVRQQLAHLGDLGPVEVRLLENGGVDVRVDGRPWDSASDGRQIVADVWLRAGLRRAMQAPVPLVVDCTQNVAGQEIPRFEPMVMLRTMDCPLRVMAKSA